MSHANTAPIDIPMSPHGMAGNRPSRVDWHTTWPVPTRWNSTQDVFHFPSSPEHEPLTAPIERALPPRQQRKINAAEEHAAQPRTPSTDPTPPPWCVTVPSSADIFTPQPLSDGSCPNTATSFGAELASGYAFDMPAAEVAVTTPADDQSQPAYIEPSGPVGDSERDTTIADSTKRCQESRFSFAFDFPDALGVAPSGRAVPQQQEPSAEEQGRADSYQETGKRDAFELESLRDALRVMSDRILNIETDTRRREEEHRVHNERREAMFQQQLEKMRGAQQSERMQEKWHGLLETLQQRTEAAVVAQGDMADTFMRAWQDAESQLHDALEVIRTNTNQYHAAAAAKAVAATWRAAIAQHDEVIAKVRSDAEWELDAAVADAVAAARREAATQLDNAIAITRSDAERDRAAAVAEAVAVARQEAATQLDNAIAITRSDAERERAAAIAEAVAVTRLEAYTQRDCGITDSPSCAAGHRFTLCPRGDRDAFRRTAGPGEGLSSSRWP